MIHKNNVMRHDTRRDMKTRNRVKTRHRSV